MKKGRWILLGLAALLVLLMTAGALYAEPIAPPVARGGDGETALRSGSGNGYGRGIQKRQRKRSRQGRRGRRGNQGRGGRYFQLGKLLDLTDGQKDEIKGIFEDHNEALDSLRNDLTDARWEFRAAMHSDAPNPDDIRAAAREMALRRADIAIEMLAVKSEVKDLLTDDQLAILDEAEQNRLEFLEGCQERIGRCIELYE
jgi:Spy/CpxP family protein refolding chaperone